MARQKTQAEFEKEIKALTGNEYSVEGEYINGLTKIQMRHNACGRSAQNTESRREKQGKRMHSSGRM